MTSSMRPIQPESHRLDMNGMSSMPAGNEFTPTIFERSTKGGRRLRYQLTILQQPERARACGSGSKSAADRRPVDPPPVVELLIFDITHGDAKDITFSYNVNFFLFATLEHARPMVHGRVQTSASASPPVLTGMPVSGMAYLDRPSVAGYFLFPDLSVRHEGRYRLAFNLYEEIKEDADADAEPTEMSSDVNDNPAFDWRMEIKSNPFTVYSAKKFPGLTESTVLSRTVADQGCRVRIRRDVRMRRREVKGGDNGRSSNRDRREPAPEQRVSRTPDRQPVDQYRARSGSSHSIHSDHGRVAPAMPPAMPPQGYQQEPQRKISISSEYQTPSHPSVHSPYNGPTVPYSYAPPAGPSHHVPQSPSHAHPAYGPSPSPYSSYNNNNNNNANASSRPSTQGYDRHNSVSSSYAPLEIDPKHERHPSVSHSVPPSPSTRYPIEHDRRQSYGHPSHVPPPPPPAPQHPPHLSYNEPTLRLPPIRNSGNLSNNLPNIPPTAPPSHTSKFINSYIEPDTDPAPPVLPSLSLGAGHKRIRDPSPSDSRRYHNGARHDPGSVPTYTPSPYLSQREGSSFYVSSAPRYTREYHFTSADGYAKSIPHNQFFDC